MTGSLPTCAAARRMDGMRGRQLAGWTTTCTIFAPSAPVPNGAGGWLDGESVVARDVFCTLVFPTVDPRSPRGEAAQTTLQHAEIRVPVGTPVSVRSRVVLADGQAFDVQGHDAGASFADSILLDCLRSDDGNA